MKKNRCLEKRISSAWLSWVDNRVKKKVSWHFRFRLHPTTLAILFCAPTAIPWPSPPIMYSNAMEELNVMACPFTGEKQDGNQDEEQPPPNCYDEGAERKK